MLYNKKIAFVFVTVLASTFLCCSGGNDDEKEIDCIKTNCADYTSQASAQAAFDSDPECHTDLDQDNDQIACEEPGNSVTTCSNTSACGCSGKNKSPCEADPCCKWVVGDGCGCK
jgi:hypothetical protein